MFLFQIIQLHYLKEKHVKIELCSDKQANHQAMLVLCSTKASYYTVYR